MMRLEETSEGTVLEVRAQPGAKRNAITGCHDGALKITVTAPPDKGKANEAIVKMLADLFQLPKSGILLKAGAASRSKRFLLRDISAAQAQALIAEKVLDE